MERDFNTAKSIVNYLENRYGNIRNNTLSDDVITVKTICTDHTLDQIEMMKNRLQKLISFHKDHYFIYGNTISIMILFFTIFFSLFVTYFPPGRITYYMVLILLSMVVISLIVSFMRMAKRQGKLYDYNLLVEEAYNAKKIEEQKHINA
ncbi:hypothetical protein [Sutcliffiella rhizosphaerae]|uniref:DUF4231 domain-containing protein n=1 Tax=Sutcliffiella rhizosphaerae TaxID=2880967 RepID=A0ABN8A886_9BACI|nr:hypothetical protein [Sutcliffiella rhizosphaerae]CAG9620869.1 hypothetical protein BACCIP111883_01640 [Sutcliffiella rhizosphaerae]